MGTQDKNKFWHFGVFIGKITQMDVLPPKKEMRQIF